MKKEVESKELSDLKLEAEKLNTSIEEISRELSAHVLEMNAVVYQYGEYAKAFEDVKLCYEVLTKSVRYRPKDEVIVEHLNSEFANRKKQAEFKKQAKAISLLIKKLESDKRYFENKLEKVNKKIANLTESILDANELAIAEELMLPAMDEKTAEIVEIFESLEVIDARGGAIKDSRELLGVCDEVAKEEIKSLYEKAVIFIKDLLLRISNLLNQNKNSTII